MIAAKQLQALRAAAEAAMQHAYAPYSQFRVGAALLCLDGTIVTGCNVENSSYPAGGCAERGALAAAIVAGHRDFTNVVVVTEAEVPTPPCGICRQALVEFSPAIVVTSFAASGADAQWTLAELLPHPFTPQSLHHL